jgi:hypothetical protein
MSAGSFVPTKYQASDENGSGIYGIRVQPETLALTINSVANDPPAGAITSRVAARTSGSRRAYGVHASKVTFRFVTAPAGYKQDSPISLPLLNVDIREQAVFGQAGVYLGVAIVVIGKSSEVIR